VSTNPSEKKITLLGDYHKCPICKRMVLRRRSDGRLRVHRLHGRRDNVCMGSETRA
jgi:hypothetical protein